MMSPYTKLGIILLILFALFKNEMGVLCSESAKSELSGTVNLTPETGKTREILVKSIREPRVIFKSWSDDEPTTRIVRTWTSESPTKTINTWSTGDPSNIINSWSTQSQSRGPTASGLSTSFSTSRDSNIVESLQTGGSLIKAQSISRSESKAPKSRSKDINSNVKTVTISESPSSDESLHGGSNFKTTWPASGSIGNFQTTPLDSDLASSWTNGDSGGISSSAIRSKSYSNDLPASSFDTWSTDLPADPLSVSTGLLSAGNALSTGLLSAGNGNSWATGLLPAGNANSWATSALPAGHANSWATNPLPAGHANSWATSPLPAGNANSWATSPLPAGNAANSWANSYLPAGTANSWATNPLPAGHANSWATSPLPASHATSWAASPLPAGHANSWATNFPAGSDNSWSGGGFPNVMLPSGVSSSSLLADPNDAYLQGLAKGYEMTRNPSASTLHQRQLLAGQGGMRGLRRRPGAKRRQSSPKGEGLTLTPNRSFGLMDRLGMMFGRG